MPMPDTACPASNPRRVSASCAPTGMPLGLLPGMSYEENITFLAPGDRLILVSDGLIEAHDAEQQIFGTKRLLETLADQPAGVELHPLSAGKTGSNSPHPAGNAKTT